tara:strand:+ start:3347 stop:3994 length:648 start_codon:yes stop_codon:yes gene_type:complete
MEIKEQILVALGLNKVQSLKLEWQAKTEDGTILVSTAEELEAGVDISVLTEDGTTIPLPIGTYKTETGMSLRVEEEGIVAELIESESEEEEEMEEEADVQDWAGMEKRIENLEIAVAKLKDGDMEKDDKEEEVEEEEMSAPSTNPKSIKTTEVVEFSLEELKEENERLKLELSKSPAEANLNTNKFSSEARNEGPTKKQLENMSASDKFLYSLQN